MIDMKLLRTNPELVKENIRKKFQDEKLPLVDEILAMDKQFRETKMTCDDLRNQRKTISKKIGALMGQGKKKKLKQSRQKWLPSARSWTSWNSLKRHSKRTSRKNDGDSEHH